MEFRFDLKPIFTEDISKINHYLLPSTFRGNRQLALDHSSKISEIIDRLGEYSANAQGLSKPVTSSQKLRLAENQRLYLLTDVNEGRYGAVIGLLKVGVKSLYVFDEMGQTRHVDAPCVLDFYIHDSRQRSGLGKILFEHMLSEENWQPQRLAVDRPSEKLVAFLRKHYGLMQPIPQTNNFVIYKGFFGDIENPATQQNGNGLHITNSPNTALFGPQIGDRDNKRKIRQQETPSPLAQIASNLPVGRYAAPKPTCSMSEIIHNKTKSSTGEPNSDLDSVHEELNNLQLSEPEATLTPEENHQTSPKHEPEDVVGEEEIPAEEPEPEPEDVEPEPEPEHTQVDNNNPSVRKIKTGKQQTGMKNMSFGVGAAVTPTNKMEFDQEDRGDFGVVKINRPPGKIMSPNNDDAMSTSSKTTAGGDGFTDQGYYDLKFYHNKLW